ncbi:MAG TPA: hypothetical protein PKO22_05075, partial [Treponemataceae bacterium]|nr:hypothetical protein [Treponemataceae bacterium]
MTKTTILLACLATAVFVFSCGTGSPTTAPVKPPVTPGVSTVTIKLDFTGPSTSMGTVYACWIENEAG